MKEHIEDTIVSQEMRNIDKELAHFLADTDEKDGE
jgi:hypothetical protein